MAYDRVPGRQAGVRFPDWRPRLGYLPLRLGLLFSYPGDVRFFSNPSHLFFLRSRAFSTRQIYPSAVHGQHAKSIRKRKSVCCPADDSTTSHSRFDYDIAYKIEIHRIAGIWQFRPFRGFARAGKNRLPVRPPRRSQSRSWAKTNVLDRSYRRGLPKGFLGANIQQSTEQASIGELEFWALDDGLGSLREPRLKQCDLTGRASPRAACSGGTAGARRT
jgi:hypothetical protein